MGRGRSKGSKSSGGSGSTIMKNGRDITRSDVAALQQAMGQTGDEAGLVNPPGGNYQKLYVNTSKSFNINYYLNTDGNSIDAPASQWQHLGYTKRMVQNDIARIDSGMKPLPQDINVTRWASGKALGFMVGGGIDDSNIGSVISRLETDSSFGSNFTSMLKGTNYTQKAYTSTSYKKTHGSYDSMPVKFNMVARKGTRAIVTNNHAESEILIGRNTKYNFTGNWSIQTVVPTSTGRAQKQLVIDVYT